MSIIFLSYREREREENVESDSEKHCIGSGVEKTIYSVQKVPR
jgi:hypothetical protein